MAELQHETETEICLELWGEHQKEPNLDMGPYWRYYSQICGYALRDRGRYVALRTHRDVTEVTGQVKAGVSRTDIKDGLRSKLTTQHAREDELLENSIDLATSLLVMIDCGSPGSLPLGFSGKADISWQDGSLEQHLGEYFCKTPVLVHNGLKLQKIFTARQLYRIAGMEIVWTDNLIDHLRLTEDDTKVHIFHHASFLKYQRER